MTPSRKTTQHNCMADRKQNPYHTALAMPQHIQRKLFVDLPAPERIPIAKMRF